MRPCGGSEAAVGPFPLSLEVSMIRFKAQGFSIDQLRQPAAAEWRRSAFQWLHLAASDRRIAAFCARATESNFCRIAKEGAL